MAAPRLLDKRTINAEAASQQRLKIVEGVTLAKKVDAIRETLGDETERLEKFRSETTAQIQREIASKLDERDYLIQGNEKIKEERIRLQAPLDLKEEWDRVREKGAEVDEWNSKLINQQVDILARESDMQILSAEVTKRESIAKNNEVLTTRLLAEAQERFEEASTVLDITKTKAQSIEKGIVEREREVSIREQEATLWNTDLQRLEAALKEKETDLSNREIALQTRYETFMRAQNYIKNKK